MQHKMKTGLRRAGAVVGLVAAVAASGAAIGHGSAGAGSTQRGMMGGGPGGMGQGMMGGAHEAMGSGMMGGAMDGEMMPCSMMGGSGMGMMQKMLDPKQRNEMRNLMQEHRPAHFERMGQMMNLRDDLIAEMRQKRPDPDAVEERHARMAELHGKMMAEMVRMRNAMHDVMTDEQRQQLRNATPESDVDSADHDAHH